MPVSSPLSYYASRARNDLVYFIVGATFLGISTPMADQGYVDGTDPRLVLKERILKPWT